MVSGEPVSQVHQHLWRPGRLGCIQPASEGHESGQERAGRSLRSSSHGRTRPWEAREGMVVRASHPARTTRVPAGQCWLLPRMAAARMHPHVPPRRLMGGVVVIGPHHQVARTSVL